VRGKCYDIISSEVEGNMMVIFKTKKRRCIMIALITVLVCFILFNVVAFIGVAIAYSKVFSHADYDEYDTNYFNTYEEIDTKKYPRDRLEIPSGKNDLAGYLYGEGNDLGLVVISPGHRDSNDIKLPEITYFVDQGYTVLCYDYTGSYRSEGDNLVGYIQAPKDLDAVLDYVENEKRFHGLPILLFGHSLGAYASTAVLQYDHNISAAVAASGFDDPTEQWEYSVKRFTGIFSNVLKPYANIFMRNRFGDMAHFSAIDGINSTEVPVLILQGTKDEYYGNVSSIYVHRDRITNPNCTIRLMEEDHHNGHYDYFLSDRAVEYIERVGHNEVTGKIDKDLYLEHDEEMMDYINAFYMREITGR
jgi:pimeloyl-ACP methyl ester carboxylesterase